ncbi:MAG: PQQ-binding-like beta-propeller repeat protein [Euryarchaeota archaeon]|nr:PQQ-binding-like beta-propeller repeat protein [Euryarchaeota archaeon]
MNKQMLYCLLIVFLFFSTPLAALPSTSSLSKIPSLPTDQYDQGFRSNIQGWIYIYIEGDPYERGFQHGILLSKEIIDMLNRWGNIIHNYKGLKQISPSLSETRYEKISETWWNFCTASCHKLYADKIPDEYQQEMQGIADGVNHAGEQIYKRNITYSDILALNEMYEFLSKTERWTINKNHPLRTFFHQLQTIIPELTDNDEQEFVSILTSYPLTDHCNGFIATGNATSHGQLVVSDAMLCGPGSWWWTYYISKRWNIILDIKPTDGHRITMASSPGFIWSDHDYYQNDAGIVLLETTVPQGLFDNIGLPLSVRVRTAMQYGDSIDFVVQSLRYKNDGAMNAVWLIGDTKTGEIARFELGYSHSYLNRTFNGFYWSANNPQDLGVRLEKLDLRQIISKFILSLLFNYPGFGYYSIRYHPENRDHKYEELGNLYYGHIDIDVVKRIMSTSPIGEWNSDCKITDTDLLKHNGLWMFYGNNMGKTENITNFNTPQPTIEPVYPTGWVKLYGIPNKNNYTLNRQERECTTQLNIRWQSIIGEQRNNFSVSSVLADTTVYSSTSEGKLIAVNTETGDIIWIRNIGEHPISPLVYNQSVYVGSATGLWRCSLNGTNLEQLTTSSIVSGPVASSDFLIFADKNGVISAYNLTRKQIQWMIAQDMRPTEIHLAIHNNILYMNIDDTCIALDIDTFATLWSYHTTGVITTPLRYQDDVIYFGSWDTNIYAVNATTGLLRWKYETGWGIDTTPVVTGTTVFVGSTDQNMYALNRENGSLRWVYTAKASIHSSPAISNDVVVFCSDDGRLYLANSSTGENKGFFAPGFTIDDNPKNYITTPIISNPVTDENTVYIGVKGVLYALTL